MALASMWLRIDLSVKSEEGLQSRVKYKELAGSRAGDRHTLPLHCCVIRFFHIQLYSHPGWLIADAHETCTVLDKSKRICTNVHLYHGGQVSRVRTKKSEKGPSGTYTERRCVIQNVISIENSIWLLSSIKACKEQKTSCGQGVDKHKTKILSEIHQTVMLLRFHAYATVYHENCCYHPDQFLDQPRYCLKLLNQV